MTVPEWSAIIALTAILAIVGWGFRRMIDTQDAMARNISIMTLDIAKLCGKLELASLIQIQDRAMCDDRRRDCAKDQAATVAHLKELSQELRKLER